MKASVMSLASGVRVRVVEHGAGPVVLLLHGNPDNADEWAGVMQRLGDGFRCVAPDLPGYGRRGEAVPLPAGWAYSVDAQVAFVDDVLAAVGAEGAVTLVVHDIGGIMGVPWAARNPARLGGVVYTNTVAFPGFRWFDVARQWGSTRLRGRLAARLTMAALGVGGGRLFARAFGQQNPQLDAAALGRFVEHFALNGVAKATTLAQFRLITRRDYFDGYDAMLDVIAGATKTRTVWGTGDPYVPDERAADMRAAETTLLDGIGHWVPLLAADAVADAVRSVAGA